MAIDPRAGRHEFLTTRSLLLADPVRKVDGIDGFYLGGTITNKNPTVFHELVVDHETQRASASCRFLERPDGCFKSRNSQVVVYIVPPDEERNSPYCAPLGSSRELDSSLAVRLAFDRERENVLFLIGR